MTALLSTTCRPGLLLTAACIIGLMVCSSCSDEGFLKESGKTNRIGLGISVSDKWNAGVSTRSAEEDRPAPTYEAYKFDDSDMWIIASDEDGIESPAVPETYALTRGVPVESVQALAGTHKAFGVYAYYSETGTFSDTVPYIVNEKISNLSQTGVATQGWRVQSQHFWPASGYLKFYAYAPFDGENKFVKADGSEGLRLEYTVATDSKNQPDILLALPQDPANTKKVYACNKHEDVELMFRHVLTAVKVRVTEGMQGKVSSVKISGVHGAGILKLDGLTFDVDKSHAGIGKNSWTFTDTDDFADVVYQAAISKTAAEDGYVVGGNITFMMLPQELSSAATMTVEFEDGTTISGKIGGEGRTGWKMGHTITYNISENGEIIVFRVTAPDGNDLPSPLEFSIHGESKNIRIISYRMDKDGNKEELPWKSERENWNFEIRPDLYNSSKDNEGYIKTGKLDNLTFTYNGRKNDMFWSGYDNHCSLEAKQTGNGRTEGEADLYANNSYSSANCYLTHHYGVQYIPLIYGNAVKNGQDNTRSYKPAGKNAKFVDGLGREITSPVINISNVDDYEAVLYWEDADVALFDAAENRNSEYVMLDIVDGNFENQSPPQYPVNGDDRFKPVNLKYIRFRILTEMVQGKEYLPVGNAVVALRQKASGTIVWCWHIWFTPYKFPGYLQTLTGTDGKTYEFLPFNLGQSIGGTITYSANKTGKVTYTQYFDREKQKPTGKVRAYDLVQGSVSGETSRVVSGSSNLYQWGRMAAFPGSDGSSIRSIIAGKQDGTLRFTSIKRTNGTATLAQSIANPTTFYFNNANGSWFEDNYYYLWDASMSSQEGLGASKSKWVKTVYDPSPAGFMVPPVNVIMNNLVSSFTDNAWTYLNTTLRLTATGRYIGQSGNMEAPSQFGYYWGSRISTNGYNPWTLVAGIAPCDWSFGSGYGHAIRPVREP